MPAGNGAVVASDLLQYLRWYISCWIKAVDNFLQEEGNEPQATGCKQIYLLCTLLAAYF